MFVILEKVYHGISNLTESEIWTIFGGIRLWRWIVGRSTDMHTQSGNDSTLAMGRALFRSLVRWFGGRKRELATDTSGRPNFVRRRHMVWAKLLQFFSLHKKKFVKFPITEQKAPNSMSHRSLQNCGSSVWYWLNVTHVVPRIWGWLVYFWEIFGPFGDKGERNCTCV